MTEVEDLGSLLADIEYRMGEVEAELEELSNEQYSPQRMQQALPYLYLYDGSVSKYYTQYCLSLEEELMRLEGEYIAIRNEQQIILHREE